MFLSEIAKARAGPKWQLVGSFIIHTTARIVRMGQLLCISTSKWVLHMPFAGQNRLSDAKTTFSVTNGTKYTILSGVNQLLGVNYKALDWQMFGISVAHFFIGTSGLMDALYH